MLFVGINMSGKRWNAWILIQKSMLFQNGAFTILHDPFSKAVLHSGQLAMIN